MFPPKKIKEQIIPIKIILEYSAIKIKENPPLKYSILNPEINSDSASAKSKGARLVSANLETNHIILKGNKINKNQIFSWTFTNINKL